MRWRLEEKDGGVGSYVDAKEFIRRIGGARWRRGNGAANDLNHGKKDGGGAGICTYAAVAWKIIESRAFLVKLLMKRDFDAFSDSSTILPVPPESTRFVEALWRRREPVPGAGR